MISFETACSRALKFVNVTQEDQLKLYGLYKQSTTGNCQSIRPSLFYPRARAKWNAWKNNTGMTKVSAKSQYVAAVMLLSL